MNAMSVYTSEMYKVESLKGISLGRCYTLNFLKPVKKQDTILIPLTKNTDLTGWSYIFYACKFIQHSFSSLLARLPSNRLVPKKIAY